MPTYSTSEKTAHVLRRLSLGGHPTMVSDLSPPEAIRRCLDISAPEKALPDLDEPSSLENAREPEKIVDPIAWWIEAAQQPARLVEERLAWMWHDLFATSIRKVPIPFVLWQQHKTIRSFATGSFADLLRAIARDPAMLVYLDGIHNAAGAINENYAREVLELHSMGPGTYTQDDISEAARALTGWLVRVPGTRFEVLAGSTDPWRSFFAARRHDGGTKTFLGVTAEHDLDSILDVILDQPATRRFISQRVYVALVGLEPSATIVDRLAQAFADYSIMNLVEAIVAEPTFLSDGAVRSLIRTPFERLITVAQTYQLARPLRFVAPVLVEQQFFPFWPPNPAGYPSGPALLGPHAVIHGFDLTSVVHQSEVGMYDPTGELHLRRLGIRDISSTTSTAIASAQDPGHQLALSVNAPEMYVT